MLQANHPIVDKTIDVSAADTKHKAHTHIRSEQITTRKEKKKPKKVSAILVKIRFFREILWCDCSGSCGYCL